MQLIKHPRFQQEYKQWYDKINRISKEETKSELTKLLTQLVNEVKKIDSHHSEMLGRTGLDMTLNETRQNITDLRRKIHKKLEECEAAGIIEKQCS